MKVLKAFLLGLSAVCFSSAAETSSLNGRLLTYELQQSADRAILKTNMFEIEFINMPMIESSRSLKGDAAFVAPEVSPQLFIRIPAGMTLTSQSGMLVPHRRVPGSGQIEYGYRLDQSSDPLPLKEEKHLFIPLPDGRLRAIIGNHEVFVQGTPRQLTILGQTFDISTRIQKFVVDGNTLRLM